MVAGPFWGKIDDVIDYRDFYVPIPWTKIIDKDDENTWGDDEWKIKDGNWYREKNKQDITPKYSWQSIETWDRKAGKMTKDTIVATKPWKSVPILHPYMKKDERHSKPEDGLFLENAVQLPEDVCLVYLSTEELPHDWYRFGGENHLVEIQSISLEEDDSFFELLRRPIKRALALITPGVWGSNRLSCRYPYNRQDSNSCKFPELALMLTDKPVPYRYRRGNKLGRGRYAVPPGTVYVLDEPLNKPWLDWPEDWFPSEGTSLKQLGCGLSLPLKIEGVD